MIMNVIILLVSFGDLLISPKKSDLSFKRTIQAEMERGISYFVKIEVTNRSPYALSYKFIDGIPQTFMKCFPLTGLVEKHSSMQITYETKAKVRGKFEIKKLYVRYTSLFGFWEKQMAVELVTK
ncbi:hypothetical protein [Bacillus sp. Bva_UNVM-123]|uniref:hypothetical protein n=1 Tax=Bacillus sp. Bva_UNVM-123 TaxID=2829798 RepID=UPI00391EE3F0